MTQEQFERAYGHNKLYLDVFPSLREMSQNLLFKGRSIHDFDAIMTRPPPIDFAVGQHESFVVAGRHGDLNSAQVTYSPRPKIAGCYLFTHWRLHELSQWLQGSGELIFGTEREHVYDAIVVPPMPFELATDSGFRSFDVKFKVQPFKRSRNPENNFLSFSTGRTFFGKGTFHTAHPVITVFGNGNINLTVNGTAIQLLNVAGSITINSEIRDAHRGGVNLNNSMRGDYPHLRGNAESNTISWTGNVQRVEIVPNWRWL